MSEGISVGAYGLFPSDVNLSAVVQALARAGFPVSDICVVLAPGHPIADAVRDAKISAADLSADAALVDTVGWLSRFGAVVIPGVGFFVGSRVFLGALIGNGSTDAAGRGVLAGLGLPKERTRHCERQLQQGMVLVFVSCERPAQAHWAREIFVKVNAVEIYLLEPAVEEAADVQSISRMVS